MLEPGEHGAAGAAGLGEHVVLDLDDAGHGQPRAAEELQAHRAHMRGHAVHDPARTGDQAVAAFLLDARQAGEELVGDVLAQARLAKDPPGDVEPLAAQQGLAAGVVVAQLEARDLDVVDLAEVVVQAHDLEPGRVGSDHAPARQVVERGAPQQRLLAASVHRDVAADAARLGTGRIDGEDLAGALGGVGHALGDDAGLAPDGGHRLREAGQLDPLDLAHALELLGVDDRALPGQRHRAAGVAGAATARDDRQAELDAAGDQRRGLGLAVGGQHDEGVLDAPVGGVGDVRDAAECVELDVVLRGVAAQHAQRAPAQRGDRVEAVGEVAHRAARSGQQLADERVARGVGGGLAAPVDLGQAVRQRLDQQRPAPGVGQQVVLQIGVALHDPDVAQHLVEHARRAPGAALLAQAVEQRPGARAEQPQHDLAVGERGVVVRNLAQPRRGCGRVGGSAGRRGQRGQEQGCIHLGRGRAPPAAIVAPGPGSGAARRRRGHSATGRKYGLSRSRSGLSHRSAGSIPADSAGSQRPSGSPGATSSVFHTAAPHFAALPALPRQTRETT